MTFQGTTFVLKCKTKQLPIKVNLKAQWIVQEMRLQFGTLTSILLFIFDFHYSCLNIFACQSIFPLTTTGRYSIFYSMHLLDTSYRLDLCS